MISEVLRYRYVQRRFCIGRLHIFDVDRIFDGYDSDSWGRVIHPLWMAIIWHVDEDHHHWTSWCAVSSPWFFPLVHGPPRRLGDPMSDMLIQFRPVGARPETPAIPIAASLITSSVQSREEACNPCPAAWWANHKDERGGAMGLVTSPQHHSQYLFSL